MPWTIKRDDRCPVTKPFAVVKVGDEHIEGCHPTRVRARRQQEALYASEAISAGMKVFEPKAYREALHPRDRHGRWATIGGSGGRTATAEGSARGGGRGSGSDVVHLAEVDASSREGYERYISAIRANPHAEFVTQPSREELAAKRVWLSEDNRVGVTVSPDGEVGNLFANPGAPKGAGGKALDMAVANGGRWLNCFDGGLVRYYRRHGFVETARLRFEPTEQPSGWNQATQDSPDIVFMEHAGQERLGNYAASWDEAEATVVYSRNIGQRGVSSSQRRASVPAPIGGIGKSLRLPKSGETGRKAAQTLAVIDKLIDIPPLEAPIPLKVTSAQNMVGTYQRIYIGNHLVPNMIRISAASEHPHLTLAHEIGHMVDTERFSVVVRDGERELPSYGSLMAAVRANPLDHPTARTLALQQAAKRQPHQVEWDAWWKAVTDSPEMRKLETAPYDQVRFHSYLRQPMETWARAFSQWVATRSGDPDLLNELDGSRNPERLVANLPPRTEFDHDTGKWRTIMPSPENVPDALRYRQWTDENFRPIGEAIDRIMEVNGYLKRSLTNSSLKANRTRSSPSGSALFRKMFDPRVVIPTEALKVYEEGLHPRDWRGRGSVSESRLGVHTTPRGGMRNPTGMDDKQAVANIIKAFEANTSADEDGRWYEKAHNQLGEWTEILNMGASQQITPQTFAGVVAACSANEMWDQPVPRTRGGRPVPIAGETQFPNLRGAARAVRVYQRDPVRAQRDPEGVAAKLGEHKGLLGSALVKSLRLLGGASPDDRLPNGKLVLNGCKERSFYNCLCWPGGTNSVAIDRHAARVITGESPPNTPLADKIVASPNTYVWAANMYRQAAKKLSTERGENLTPDVVQAASWAQWRREHEPASRARPSRKKTLTWQALGGPLEVDGITGQLVGEPSPSPALALTPRQQQVWAEINRWVEQVERSATGGTQATII